MNPYRRYGLWATNSGQNPDISRMVSLVKDGCYTLMHSAFSVAEARYIVGRWPEADILVRHHCYDWPNQDPVEWARTVFERMEEYKPLGIRRLVGANEPNLEPHNDFTRTRFEHFGRWYGAFVEKIRHLDLDDRVIVHFPAFAAGHHEDLPHPEEGWIGLDLDEMVFAMNECDAVNFHTYWDPDEGPLREMGKRGGGLRYHVGREVLKQAGIDLPIWIDEAGPWGQPWRMEQIAAHSEQCQQDGVAVTYFLWSDPTNNAGNVLNEWYRHVNEAQLTSLQIMWDAIADKKISAQITPPPQPQPRPDDLPDPQPDHNAILVAYKEIVAARNRCNDAIRLLADVLADLGVFNPDA